MKNKNNDAQNIQNENKKARKSKVKQSEIPRFSLEDALRIAHSISDNYAKSPTKPLNVAVALDTTPGSGHFRNLLGASSAYGLTEGTYTSDLISITDLGLRIVSPTDEEMENSSKKEAFLRPRVIKEFLEKYQNSKLPPNKIAQNVLEEIGLPNDSTEEAFNLILSTQAKVLR